jgi:hypothetical protein
VSAEPFAARSYDPAPSEGEAMREDFDFDAGEHSTGTALVLRQDTLVGAYDPIEKPPPMRSYAELERAINYFNRELFENKLPSCMLTIMRKRGAYGYYSPDRLINIDDPFEVTDEIGLNPTYFATELTTNVLATVVHEQAHHWQHHFGQPSARGYHNAQWARKMVIPSSTGAPGGKSTGVRMSHYIQPGGRFEIACAAFLAENSTTLFQDAAHWIVRPNEDGTLPNGLEAVIEKLTRDRLRKAASKTRFTCCGQNAWAKPSVQLICGVCKGRMSAIRSVGAL